MKNYSFSLLDGLYETTYSEVIRNDLNKLDDSSKKIIMIGDSFVYGDNLDNEEDVLSSILEKRYYPDYSVVNLGIPGSCLDTASLMLTKFLNDFPDNVCAIVFGCTFHARQSVYFNKLYRNHCAKPANGDFKNLYSTDTMIDSNAKPQPVPILDLQKWEKNFMYVYYVSKALNCKMVWWDMGDSYYLSGHDRKFIEDKASKLATKIDVSLPSSDLLECGHWNGNGNEKIAQRIYNVLGNL